MRIALLAGLVLLMAVSPALAQREDAKPPNLETRPRPDTRAEAAKRSAEESQKPVEWRPQRRGSPRGRVAGGVRGGSALPQPLVLAPDHDGLTTRATPSLFWHLDGTPPETARIVFTLTLADGVEPVVERELSLPAAAGIQRVRLADLGVALTPEVDYAWSVSLVTGDDHSTDAVSEGSLRLVAADALEGLAPSARAFAEKGLWYDALEALSDAIDAAPAQAELRAQRDSLLRQAGLDAAVAEHQQARP